MMLVGASCARLPPHTGLSEFASFPVGTSVVVEKLQSHATYRGLIEREFSSVTANHEMKMASLQPQKGQFDWQQADALVQFARRHRQRVHGHTLVWHQALPEWVRTFQGDTAAWEQVFKQHIQTTARHFRRRVKAWDVVNEALESNGTYTRSVWHTHLGPGYVARAFQYARQAAPRAKLFYNDFDLESNPAKLDHTLRLLTSLRAQGIRVDGVGFQMHTSIEVPTASIREALHKVAALGYLVHISELDVEINRRGTLPANAPPPAELLARQQTQVRNIVIAYRQLPPAQQYGITFWGVSDADTWLREFKHHPEWPLLFDDNYQPKPAYLGFWEGTAFPKSIYLK